MNGGGNLRFNLEGPFEWDCSHGWQYGPSEQWKLNGGSLQSQAKAVFVEKTDEQNTKTTSPWKSLASSLSLEDTSLSSAFKDWAQNGTTKLKAQPAIAILLTNVFRTGVFNPPSGLETVVSLVFPHMTVEIRGLPEGQPCWYYLNLEESDLAELVAELAIVCPAIFFKENTRLSSTQVKMGAAKTPPAYELDGSRKRQWGNLVDSYRTKHYYSVIELKHNGTDTLTVKLRIDTTLTPYPKGRICQCIPVPGKRDDKKGEKEPLLVATPEVVFASPHVAGTLEQLSEIWQDRFAKSVLISAPPGSGKENFAASIPYGNGRASNVQTLSLADGDKASLELRLYGKKRDDGSIQDGLLVKAAGSALFLDEAHYPETEAGIRASLLRVLEADEYFPVGATQVEKTKDVLYVLATSKRLQGSGKSIPLSKIPPQDFWTRVTYLLQIEHPLRKTTDKNGSRKTLAAFYNFFWWDRAVKYFNREPDLADVDPTWGTGTDGKINGADLLYHAQIRDLFDEKILEKLSGTFANTVIRSIGTKNLPTLSIRSIRTIVNRLFAIAVSAVAGGQEFPYTKDEAGQLTVITTFISDLQKVLEEVHEVAKLDPGDGI